MLSLEARLSVSEQSEWLYRSTIEDADFSAMIEITPEGVIIERLPNDDPAPDSDGL